MNVNDKINSKIDSLMGERQVIISEMNALSKQYDAYKVRLVEVEGAIKEFNNLLVEDDKEASDDTESNTEQGSDTDKG